jgi:hypothetical protein
MPRVRHLHGSWRNCRFPSPSTLFITPVGEQPWLESRVPRSARSRNCSNSNFPLARVERCCDFRLLVYSIDVVEIMSSFVVGRRLMNACRRRFFLVCHATRLSLPASLVHFWKALHGHLAGSVSRCTTVCIRDYDMVTKEF